MAAPGPALRACGRRSGATWLALLPTPKRPSSEQQLNLPKFIQTEVPSSPWDSCNPNYQARDTNGWVFRGFRQSPQQVALMVAAGTTDPHKSKASRVLPAATGRAATEPAGWGGPLGLCREGGCVERRKGDRRSGREAPCLSRHPPSLLPSVFLLCPRPLLTQPQRSLSTRPGVGAATPRLASRPLAPVPPVHSSVTSLGVCLQQDFQTHSWMASWGQRWPTLMVFAGTAQI